MGDQYTAHMVCNVLRFFSSLKWNSSFCKSKLHYLKKNIRLPKKEEEEVNKHYMQRIK